MSFELIAELISQVMFILACVLLPMYIARREKKEHVKEIKEEIACLKREIWNTQKELSAIVVSGDETVINSEYVKQKVQRLKDCKAKINELNSQLRDKDKDKTKLNVSEMVELMDKFKKGDK